MNTVFCLKYKKDLPALTKAPFPGPAGDKILENISQRAWEAWLNVQTMHYTLLKDQVKIIYRSFLRIKDAI